MASSGTWKVWNLSLRFSSRQLRRIPATSSDEMFIPGRGISGAFIALRAVLRNFGSVGIVFRIHSSSELRLFAVAFSTYLRRLENRRASYNQKSSRDINFLSSSM